jgi:hypothetical protein
MNLAALRLEALRRRREEYIRDYANRTGLATRKDARMWALFFSALIRRIERHERA